MKTPAPHARFLYPPEAWALGLAALGHDLAHPGLDNAHQVRVGSELATRYSDVKPLEANSSAITLKLIKKVGRLGLGLDRAI